MNHFRAGILVLTCAGISDRQHFASGFWSHQIHARVLHGQFRADVAIDPLHVALGFDTGTLGDQVVHIWRPVLDRRIRHVRTWLDNDLHDRRMQRIVGVHRCRTTFDVMHLGTFIGNDQRAFKLSGIFAIDTEVGLKWHFAFHPGGT